MAGVGKTAVFDIEHGKETVQFNTLQSVCRALNITITLESPIMEQCEEELNAKAEVFMHGKPAGLLVEEEKNGRYLFAYGDGYEGPPISVTMPVEGQRFEYNRFPPFFDGLLPEGMNLETLLRSKKIDRDDAFSQLMAVGNNTVGAVTVREVIP